MGAVSCRSFTFTPRTALLYDKEPHILHERTCRRVSDAHATKIKIPVTPVQADVLWHLSEKCRLLYNFALAERN
ncbi:MULTISPECIES: helix-turn-helix domain-containing protein [unclassified Methanoculleus]|jgi:hypothetical protein|uniref:helix-turn-helix domain-containing protein n=1 Tax=unclassified Methanoculleus TaxID=2619537 RepID=UPI003743B81F